jgi:hypothetical protein
MPAASRVGKRKSEELSSMPEFDMHTQSVVDACLAIGFAVCTAVPEYFCKRP